jgi:hypothetical protein
LKRKEIKEKIKTVLQFHEELNDKWSALEKVLGADVSMGLGDLSWRLFDKYTDAIQREIGDDNQWVAWWIFDNKMGKNKLTAIPSTGKERVEIKNLDDLVDLIKRI